MKYKKILAIAAAIVVLISCFSFSAFAYSANLSSDGWVNITVVDRIVQNRPTSTGSNFTIFTRDNVSLPVSFGYTATNSVNFSSSVYIYFSSSGSLSDIIIPNGYGYDLDMDFAFYIGGSSVDVSVLSGVISFYDSSMNLYSFPLSFSVNPDADWRRVLSASIKNDTGKDLYLGSINYFVNQSAVVGTWYDTTYSSIKYRSLSPQDQITQGWAPDPEAPSGAGTVDQQTQLEDQIMQDSEQGLNDATSALNAAGSLLAVFRDGFIFLMGLFGLATDISLVNNLLSISLALGIFTFLLNLAAGLMKKKGGD